MNRVGKAVAGNICLIGYVSANRQIAAIRLFYYAGFQYVAAISVNFCEGGPAKPAAALLS